MYFGHEFPYTNFHELNLSWFIARFKEFLAQFTTLQNDLNTETQNRINADDDLQNQITNNLNDINSQIANLITKHNADVTTLKLNIYEYYLYSKNYTDTEIQKLLAMINKPVQSPTFNYFQQKITPLQTTLFDYYIHLRPHCISAKDFDILGLSCDELDSDISISTFDFDIYSRDKYFDYKKHWPWFAYDPYTGKQRAVSQIVENLYQLHYTGLTTEQFDNMTFTCNEFDNSAYTAYQMDWTTDIENIETGGTSL